MYEYAVKSDRSVTARNDPAAMAKTINQMATDGWRLVSATSVAHPLHSLPSPSESYVYMFFERVRQ